MISPPDIWVWSTIAMFLFAGIVSFVSAVSGHFVQKRPWPMPLLISLIGVIDIIFAIKYAQLVIPGFPGWPAPSVEGRPYFLLIAVAMLFMPVGYIWSGYRELALIRNHTEQLEAKRHVAEHEKQKLLERLDAAQEQNAQQRQQFFDLKQLIISNVSHELRTPMAIALGFVYMIMTGTYGQVDGTPLHEPLMTVHTSTQRMVAVVERMVNTWREPAFTLTDLAEIGRQLLASNGIWLNTRRNPADVTITSDIPDHLFAVGDTEMLRTAVFELLNNAIKFGATEIHLSMFEEDSEIVTQVRDNGIGISRKYHRQVFEPLYQIQMGSTRKYEGAGMGLAAVESVAHAHDGHTYVQSRLGQGAIFYLIIPAKSVVPLDDVAAEGKD